MQPSIFHEKLHFRCSTVAPVAPVAIWCRRIGLNCYSLRNHASRRDARQHTCRSLIIDEQHHIESTSQYICSPVCSQAPFVLAIRLLSTVVSIALGPFRAMFQVLLPIVRVVAGPLHRAATFTFVSEAERMSKIFRVVTTQVSRHLKTRGGSILIWESLSPAPPKNQTPRIRT